jgi:prepilin-type N-terminal cleavage/methylation domain-containing protein
MCHSNSDFRIAAAWPGLNLRNPGRGTEDSTPATRRRAFTLVELLIVITLLLVLLGLTIVFVPRFQENQRVSQGATSVQSTLLIVKQRALRDRVPTGVRFPRGLNNPLWITEMQYIQQPEDFSGGTAETISDYLPNQAPAVTFKGVSLTGFSDPTLWEVQPGDWLELRGGGLIRRITSIDPGGTQATLDQLAPTSPVLYRVAPTKNYRIIRAPRVTADDPVQLPDSVAIDLTVVGDPKKKSEYTPQVTQHFDILFAPSGEVIGPAARFDKIILWVRDTSLGVTEGGPTLICIYTRSGAIAAHPVDVQGADYYSFTQDGR